MVRVAVHPSVDDLFGGGLGVVCGGHVAEGGSWVGSAMSRDVSPKRLTVYGE